MQETRKLSTILFGDIAGYTSLMASDEKYALGLLNQFKSILEQIVPDHSGEIIQYFGDACLLSFDSTTLGVQCAIDLQRKFREHDIPTRIGMHLGEVVFKNNNAFGDGVNIASRIESMNVPGAILVSKAIRDQIHNKSEFGMSSLGSFDFKNVLEPIDVFALTNEGLVVPQREDLKGKGKQKEVKRVKWQSFILPVILIAALILAGSYFFSKDGSLKASENEAGFESTIAVFPFEVKGSSDIEYLGDGVVDLISTQLDEIPKLNSIDPNRIFGQLEKETTISRNPEKAAKLSKSMGATKFILGSIVQIGDDLQFSATKYDALGKEITRQSVKANKTEGIVKTINDLIQKIVADELKEANFELGNLGALTSNNLESLKFYLEGEQALRDIYIDESRELFIKATEADSTFALAWMRLFEAYGGISSSTSLTKQRAKEKWAEYKHTMPSKWQLYYEAASLAHQGNQKAIAVYNNLIRRYGDTPAFHYALGEFKFYLNEAYGRSPTEAKPHFLKTLELEPDHQEVLIQLGQIAVLENDMEGLQRALSLRNENNTRGLKVLKLILQDTVTDPEIENALNFTASVRLVGMSYFVSEEKPFHNELISRIVQRRPSANEVRVANAVRFGTTGREKEGFEAWKELGKMEISYGVFKTDLLARSIPANLIAVEEFKPFSEHYETLFQETKDRNTPWEIFAAIKYALALNKKKEVMELKEKLQSLGTTPQTKSMVKYFSFSIQAFEAKMAGENDKALAYIDSVYQNPIGFWETQLPYMDKSIMAANIYAEEGEYEKAINYFNHSFLTLLGSDMLMGYRNYKLSQWYEAIDDTRNALLRCNILLESYKNCDEKYRPWVEEVEARRERLISQMN